MLANKHILLIVGGGIAAFKSLDLVRRLRERGAQVTPVPHGRQPAYQAGQIAAPDR